MNIFDGVVTNWGFEAGDIWTSVMTIVGSVAPFLLLGIAVMFAPKAYTLIKSALSGNGGKK